MYNLLIALGSAVAITFFFGTIFGGGNFRLLYGLFPGILSLGVVYVLLARRTMKKIEAVIALAQNELKNQNIDRGIQIFKDAKDLSKWQFGLESQLDGQIGSILYMSRKFEEALPYLRRASKRHWVSKGMLGVLYYKKKEHDKMKEAFELAAAASKKESLLWNLYAYCLWKAGKKDEAIEVLNRGIKVLGEDQRTQRNLDALKNNRKMKMRGWNMMWYQFHLDKPPAQKQQVQFRRR